MDLNYWIGWGYETNLPSMGAEPVHAPCTTAIFQAQNAGYGPLIQLADRFAIRGYQEFKINDEVWWHMCNVRHIYMEF